MVVLVADDDDRCDQFGETNLRMTKLVAVAPASTSPETKVAVAL